MFLKTYQRTYAINIFSKNFFNNKVVGHQKPRNFMKGLFTLSKVFLWFNLSLMLIHCFRTLHNFQHQQFLRTIPTLWHYQLWSFKSRDTKLERLLHKNQLVYFWTESRKNIYGCFFHLFCATDLNFGTKNNGRMK